MTLPSGVRMSTLKKQTGRFLGSLGTRLFAWIFVVLATGFGLYASYNVSANSSFCVSCALSHAAEISEIVERATQYAMLRNHKEEVGRIIEDVGRQDSVVGVRIFDKTGRTVFSDAPGEIGRFVDKKAEACNSCHLANGDTLPGPYKSRTRSFKLPDGTPVLGVTQPIENLPKCYNAACHAHPKAQTVLGVIDLRTSMRAAEDRRKQVILHGSVAAALISLLAAFAAAVFIQVLVRRPINNLVMATDRVASGELAVQVESTSNDEIGRLGRSFNRMSKDLSQAREALTEWSARLETRLVEKTEELGHTQQQVVHMEKMASLGKLSATVAHELNNPLAGILNYTKLLKRTLKEENGKVIGDADHEEMLRWLDFVAQEAKRTGDIVRNLLLFARGSGSNQSQVRLREILDRSLMLIQHHLDISNVKLEKAIADGDDAVTCDPDKIHQALVALLVNAVESMPNGGTLSLSMLLAESEVEIKIADTGGGIPDDVLPHIFEPFYSTKGKAHGVGLGLAVVYGIVRKHGGNIQVTTQLGEGTTFCVTLPRVAELNEEDSEAHSTEI